MRGLLAALLIAVGSVGVAASDEPASAPDPTRFAGTWKLDAERSDSSLPMLEALEAPWFARRAMSSFRTTLTITSKGSGLHVRSSAPMGRSREREMPGDGSELRGEDQLGRRFVETSRWSEAGSEMLIERSVELEEGRTARIEGRWQRSGDVIEIDTRVRAAGEPVRVKRVFQRVVLDDES